MYVYTKEHMSSCESFRSQLEHHHFNKVLFLISIFKTISTLFTKSFPFLFYVYMWFCYMYHMHTVHKEAKRRYLIPWKWITCWATLWVLREPGLSSRTVSGLNSWAISPIPTPSLILFYFIFWDKVSYSRPGCSGAYCVVLASFNLWQSLLQKLPSARIKSYKPPCPPPK